MTGAGAILVNQALLSWLTGEDKTTWRPLFYRVSLIGMRLDGVVYTAKWRA